MHERRYRGDDAAIAWQPKKSTRNKERKSTATKTQCDKWVAGGEECSSTSYTVPTLRSGERKGKALGFGKALSLCVTLECSLVVIKVMGGAVKKRKRRFLRSESSRRLGNRKFKKGHEFDRKNRQKGNWTMEPKKRCKRLARKCLKPELMSLQWQSHSSRKDETKIKTKAGACMPEQLPAECFY
ncbi:hypothetical protein Dsin_027188 [Dipteronia sinensis]|uniref:Uncharacterized protein n=1 Tax=Dipteronia sinensis TaxID=43782 RepID=A0AAE0A0G2_9ROSI|nr:hypothetical protein Dsin_027188 [Dipteronia sinensis]